MLEIDASRLPEQAKPENSDAQRAAAWKVSKPVEYYQNLAQMTLSLF
jgi:hypothetical protein